MVPVVGWWAACAECSSQCGDFAVCQLRGARWTGKQVLLHCYAAPCAQDFAPAATDRVFGNDHSKQAGGLQQQMTAAWRGQQQWCAPLAGAWGRKRGGDRKAALQLFSLPSDGVGNCNAVISPVKLPDPPCCEAG